MLVKVGLKSTMALKVMASVRWRLIPFQPKQYTPAEQSFSLDTVMEKKTNLKKDTY